MVTVTWTFRNDHVWSQSFDTEDAVLDFVNRVGLVSHPDIKTIVVKREAGVDLFLKNGLTHW